jgi:Glycosyltransferase (GlcNAc)
LLRLTELATALLVLPTSSTLFIKSNAKKPKLTNLVWGAGMSFQKCHAELNVPYDPYLDNVFDGEETSRGIRFFTHGYDVYTPDKVLVTHDYEGHQSNPIIHSWGGKRKNAGEIQIADQQRKDKFDKVDWSYMDHWTKMKGVVQPDGVSRINILMEVKSDHTDPELKRLIVDGRFGLGTLRSLDQAYEFAGFSNKDLKMHVNRCGNIKWVPFGDSDEINENSDWGVGINLQRRIWNETEPFLPPPEGRSSSFSRSLTRDGVGAVVHPFSHGSSYHTAGWCLMLVFVFGGYFHRRGSFKSRKNPKLL